MNSGQKLRKSLGLTRLPHVLINRVKGTGGRIYFVWFDSLHPSRPLNRSTVLSSPAVLSIFKVNGDVTEKDVPLSTFLRLDDFATPIRGGHVFAIDLAGKQWINSKFREDVHASLSFLMEGYNVADLRQNAIDDHTKSFYDAQFNQAPSPKLRSVKWNDKNKRAVGKDRYTSTLTCDYAIGSFTGSVKGNYTKGGQATGAKGNYTVKVQFQGINEWVANREEFLSLSEADQLEFIQGVIDSAEVKVFSDDPSWVMQGSFYNAAELDYSIYPYPDGLPKPTGHWAKIKTGKTELPYFSISKHVMKVLDHILENPKELLSKIKDTYK